MRFFRLPRFGTGKKGAPSLLSGERLKLTLIALVLLFVSFAISLYLFFPSDALKERVEWEVRTQTPAQLQIGKLDLEFPLSFKGRDVVVKDGIPGRPSLEIASAVLKPAWGTLVGSNPGISFQAEFQGGRVEGTARKKGDLQAYLKGVRFNEPLMKGSSMTAAGTLAEGHFKGAVPLRNGTETELDLRFEQVQVNGLDAIGAGASALSLGTVRLKASGRSNSLKVDEFVASGGELEASGSGSILVFNPMERSRINLNLELRPTQDMDSNLKEMLNLFLKPSRDGSSRLRITGTLASPAVR